MKTIKILAATALVALVFAHGFSSINIKNSNLDVSISASGKSVIVKLGDVKKEVIDVKIVDENDNVLLDEKVRNKIGFIKKYNMGLLVNGNYSLIITKTSIRTTQPFTVFNGKLMLLVSDKKDEFVPVLKYSNDKLDVNFLLENNGKIQVKLFDNEGQILLDVSYEEVTTFNKRYNLFKLKQGYYEVEVVVNGEIFTYSIVK
jgi:hypothetical protein